MKTSTAHEAGTLLREQHHDCQPPTVQVPLARYVWTCPECKDEWIHHTGSPSFISQERYGFLKLRTRDVRSAPIAGQWRCDFRATQWVPEVTA